MSCLGITSLSKLVDSIGINSCQPPYLCSALDAESEYLVQDALQKLMVGRTTIIIAHRLSTIKAAHQVAVVDGGKIAESGTYEELIQIEDGLFRKLVEKQSNMNER